MELFHCQLLSYVYLLKSFNNTPYLFLKKGEKTTLSREQCFHALVKYGGRYPKFIWAPRAQLYSLAENPQLPPRIWTPIARVLLVSQDRRHFCFHELGPLILIPTTKFASSHNLIVIELRRMNFYHLCSQ